MSKNDQPGVWLYARMSDVPGDPTVRLDTQPLRCDGYVNCSSAHRPAQMRMPLLLAGRISRRLKYLGRGEQCRVRLGELPKADLAALARAVRDGHDRLTCDEIRQYDKNLNALLAAILGDDGKEAPDATDAQKGGHG